MGLLRNICLSAKGVRRKNSTFSRKSVFFCWCSFTCFCFKQWVCSDRASYAMSLPKSRLHHCSKWDTKLSDRHCPLKHIEMWPYLIHSKQIGYQYGSFGTLKLMANDTERPLCGAYLEVQLKYQICIRAKANKPLEETEHAGWEVEIENLTKRGLGRRARESQKSAGEA